MLLAPHFAAALLARDVTEGTTADRDREFKFDFVLTYDLTTVTTAARTLMSRIPVTEREPQLGER